MLESHGKKQSIPAEYLELIESDRVSAQTRAVLLARAEPETAVYQPRVLNAPELVVLRAVSDCVLPQDGEGAYIDLAASVDRQLADGMGNGWRYDLLPRDDEAYRAGILTLDTVAQSMLGVAFAALPKERQQEVLERSASGLLDEILRPGPGMPADVFNGEQMKRWFEEVRGDLVRVYVAHPATLARIGFSGIGDGADSETMPGFVELGLGQRESWELLPLGGARWI